MYSWHKKTNSLPHFEWRHVLVSLNMWHYLSFASLQFQATSKQYTTTILYYCPSNLTLPTIISSNFSFDYTKSLGIIKNVTAVCEIDRYIAFFDWLPKRLPATVPGTFIVSLNVTELVYDQDH